MANVIKLRKGLDINLKGKPAAVPSGCSGADGDFVNRNL